MTKFTNNKLEELASDNLVFDKIYSKYQKKTIKLLKSHDILVREGDIVEKDFDYIQDSLIHDDLWFDLSDLIHELAQLVLEERESRKKACRYFDDAIQDLKQISTTMKRDTLL